MSTIQINSDAAGIASGFNLEYMLNNWKNMEIGMETAPMLFTNQDGEAYILYPDSICGYNRQHHYITPPCLKDTDLQNVIINNYLSNPNGHIGNVVLWDAKKAYGFCSQVGNDTGVKSTYFHITGFTFPVINDDCQIEFVPFSRIINTDNEWNKLFSKMYRHDSDGRVSVLPQNGDSLIYLLSSDVGKNGNPTATHWTFAECYLLVEQYVEILRDVYEEFEGSCPTIVLTQKTKTSGTSVMFYGNAIHHAKPIVTNENMVNSILDKFSQREKIHTEAYVYNFVKDCFIKTPVDEIEFKVQRSPKTILEEKLPAFVDNIIKMFRK